MWHVLCVPQEITIDWFWEGATAAMLLCIKVCLRRRVLINNNQMTVSQMAHNKQSTSKKRAAIIKASCVQITWYNKLQWRECAVLCQRLCHYGHFPEGFCIKTLFDNDWEGRANRSQHAHGKQERYYQIKWNIFTTMFIYEMSIYYLVLSCISYSAQMIHQHSWYFVKLKTPHHHYHVPRRIAVPTPSGRTCSIIKRTRHIFSLSSVHLYFCCILWWLTKVEAGLPNWGGIECACICQLLILLWDIKLRASVAHLTPLFSHRCSRKLDSWMHPHYYWGLTRIVNNDVLASTNICLRFALPIPCPNRSFFGAPSPDRSW